MMCLNIASDASHSTKVVDTNMSMMCSLFYYASPPIAQSTSTHGPKKKLAVVIQYNHCLLQRTANEPLIVSWLCIAKEILANTPFCSASISKKLTLDHVRKMLFGIQLVALTRPIAFLQCRQLSCLTWIACCLAMHCLWCAGKPK
jgi:hypothetical protein